MTNSFSNLLNYVVRHMSGSGFFGPHSIPLTRAHGWWPNQDPMPGALSPNWPAVWRINPEKWWQ